MKIRSVLLSAAVTASFLSYFACQSGQGGIGSLTGVSDEDMAKMGTQAFEDLKKKTPAETDPATNAYVRCVANAVLAIAKDPTGVSNWEIVVFKDPTANAFALPGGKIGVHTGLLPVANNQDMLATVLGHEVGHVIKRHGAARVAAGGILEKVAGGLGAILVSDDNPYKEQMMGALGMGVNYGAAMPFSRMQESEADLVGLDLMARAGFNPGQSVILWKNMSAMGGKRPPAILSDHPSDENRIKALQGAMPKAMQQMAAANAQGRNPSCK